MEQNDLQSHYCFSKIYWTDTNSMEGKGTLTRMDLNGSNPEVLLRNLHWPRALAIDYEREEIYRFDRSNICFNLTVYSY